MKSPNLIEKAFVLKKTSLFSEINLDNLLAIVHKLDAFDITPNQYLFKQSQVSHYIYIILQGSVELITEEGVVLQRYTKGDIIGAESLFRNEHYSENAKVVEKGQLLALTKKNLTAIIEECPSVAIKLLESFAKQIPELSSSLELNV